MQKKIALINDVTGFGRCSIAVMAPIVSAMKIQAVTVPTAILSTHTQFPIFYFDDYTPKMRDYIQSLYKPEPDERIFPFTKYFLTSEMQRGSKATGVKRIRIHDLRHSHISLLIDMGFPLTAIAARVGHETVDITCMYGHISIVQ